MKKILFIIGVILLFGNQGTAQSSNKDFVVIGVGTKNSNVSQLQKRNEKQNIGFQIMESQVNTLEQIALALDGQMVHDLQLYLETKPGELIFNRVVITSANVGEFKEQIVKWKNFVAGKVVVHSLTAFTTPEGIELKKQLEELSGLEFVMIK